MKQMPQIQKLMTFMPHTIKWDASLAEALDLMTEQGMRHLPVLNDGRLVGIISNRDIQFASVFQGVSPMKVEDVMTPNPYVVVPEAPLDQVVLKMAENKYGCAIVAQTNGKVVGIFTANDGLRILGEQMATFYKHNPLDSEASPRL